MKGKKAWGRAWFERPRDLATVDLDHKTLTDLRCEQCGRIHRLLLSYREFAIARYCEHCGGHLENTGNENIILQVMKMMRAPRDKGVAQAGL